MAGFTDTDVPEQAGRTFLVTGANTGIGFELARVLAGKGARVLLACRDKARADEAMRRIGGGDIAHLPLDLADLDSVRAAAAIAAREPRLDGVIANAGVMFPPLTRTAQGHELQWGVNHLGHFALTGLLLGKLAVTPGARVVVTSSLAHLRGDIQWDDLDAHKRYSKTGRYSDSKLANLLHVAELDRRLRADGSPVSAIGCHPGIAGTDLGRHTGPMKVFFKPVSALFNTALQGAWPALQAACDPNAEPGGYYGPTQWRESRGVSGPARRSDAARDPELARRLWDVSVAMTGVDPGLAPA